MPHHVVKWVAGAPEFVTSWDGVRFSINHTVGPNPSVKEVIPTAALLSRPPPPIAPLTNRDVTKHVVVLMDFDGSIQIFVATGIPKVDWLAHAGWMYIPPLPDPIEVHTVECKP